MIKTLLILIFNLSFLFSQEIKPRVYISENGFVTDIIELKPDFRFNHFSFNCTGINLGFGNYQSTKNRLKLNYSDNTDFNYGNKLEYKKSKSDKITIDLTVFDDNYDEHLSGVNCFAGDESIGTVSNNQGKIFFEIKSDSKKLIISYLGYAIQKIDIPNGVSEINGIINLNNISKLDSSNDINYKIIYINKNEFIVKRKKDTKLFKSISKKKMIKYIENRTNKPFSFFKTI